MSQAQDPTTMTSGDRLRELTLVLANGFLRHVQKALADATDPEAPCVHAVDTEESAAGKESL